MNAINFLKKMKTMKPCEACGTRSQSSFLVKPKYEGGTFSCYEWGFDASCQCRRVMQLDDMLQGVTTHTEQERYELTGRQPLFWLQERFASEGGYEWNGLLLFAAPHNEAVRQRVLQLKEQMQVVMAFYSPLTTCYYLLVDTGTGGGNEEAFRMWQHDQRQRLSALLGSPLLCFDLKYYVRAVAQEHFDYVARDVLFGAPAPAPPSSRKSFFHFLL